jgi:type I restriction enzyme S subunit
MKYAEYSNYKFSGTEWIGDIPSEWECRRLKDCGALLAGAGFPHEYQGLEDEELPFYKVGDLSQSLDGRHMASGKHTISRATAYTLRAKVIPPSAIVYAKIGAALFLNRRRITVKNCCIDNNMTGFIPNQQKLSTAWAN